MDGEDNILCHKKYYQTMRLFFTIQQRRQVLLKKLFLPAIVDFHRVYSHLVETL